MKTDIDKLLELRAKYALLEEMCQTYRSSRSIGNILSNISDEIKAIENKLKYEQTTNA